MFYYYKINNKVAFSRKKFDGFFNIEENEIKEKNDTVYFLHSMNPMKSRRSFCISDPSLLFLEEEGVHLLRRENITDFDIPDWILSKINERKVMAINTQYANWLEILDYKLPSKWRINILALGDVGGMLLTGLRLLGGNSVKEIGIYDRSENKIKRWEYEMNQVMAAFHEEEYPTVHGISKDELFNCDMFVFCASSGVPQVGSKVRDVRMVQFEDNSKIIKEYARLARETGFNGIFAVVSDPVDLLCKVVFLESNKNQSGEFDFKGLGADQIRGYGLGVMNARAAYYARKNPNTIHYLKEGRAFGPHGEGLLIANSIENYNEELSEYLTVKARNANIKVRETGFKPYIAPALSSGSLSIIATINGDWHYSATFMGGVYMGAKNRLISAGTEVERLDIPDLLFNKIKNTYKRLGDII